MGTILGDFFTKVGGGLDKMFDGEILDGIGDVLGAPFDAAGRTINGALNLVGLGDEQLHSDYDIDDRLGDYDIDDRLGDYDIDDRLAGPEIQHAKNLALRAKYDMLKSLLPQIGPLESGRHLEQEHGAWILDFGGFAAIVGPTTFDPVCFEVHGGIYSAWKENGGALGPLGRPVSDEQDYNGPDARLGDRFSKFENGVIVWRADTWKTEVRMNLWQDEFEGTAIDASKWSFEIGTGSNGWGNNEKEFYTDRPDNAYVKDGILHICCLQSEMPLPWGHLL